MKKQNIWIKHRVGKYEVSVSKKYGYVEIIDTEAKRKELQSQAGSDVIKKLLENQGK